MRGSRVSHPKYQGQRIFSSGINLTRIEARPAHFGNWSYVFFLDVEGHASDPALAAAISDVRGLSMDLRVLGSYPRGDV